MTYKDDERYNAWMREIIESAWQAVEEYENFLRGTQKVKQKNFQSKMRKLYEQLPVDPGRKNGVRMKKRRPYVM